MAEVDLNLHRAIKEMAKDNLHSHFDILALQAQNMYVPVFVYGNEMENFSGHAMLLGGMKMGLGRTADRSFTLYRDKQWRRPMAFWEKQATNSAAIYGEVYLVTPDAIARLDDYYERGLYSRRLRRSILHYAQDQAAVQDKTWYTVQAFMYHFVKDNFEDRLKNPEDFQEVPLVMDQLSQRTIYRWFMNDDAENRARQARNKNVMKEVSKQLTEKEKNDTALAELQDKIAGDHAARRASIMM